MKLHKIFCLTIISTNLFYMSCLSDMLKVSKHTNQNDSLVSKCKPIYYEKGNDSFCYDLQKQLYEAVINNKTDEIKHLLSQGANVDGSIDQKFPPLQTASFSGNLEAAKLLIDNGADVNRMVGIGNTALKHATGYNRIEIVKLLIESQVDVCENTDISALQIAKNKKYVEIEKLLIDAGAENCR